MSASPAEPLPRKFRWFWAGEAVSGFGAWITLLALQALVVTHLEAGTTGTGLLSAARWLPYLLFGLILGALIDRRARRPVMIATDLVRAILLVLIPLAWWAGVLSLPVLLVIVFAFGAATLMNDSASQAFVPRLVPRVHLQRAHARIDGTNAVAETAGPATGGVLLSLVGAPLAVLVNAGTFIFSAVMVALTRVNEAVPASPRPHLRREIVDGLRWVYRTRELRHLAIWTHVWFAGQAALGAVLAVYLLTTMALSYLWFGLVTAAAGVGALGGAMASLPLGRRLGSGGTVILTHALSTAGVATVLSAQYAGPDWFGIALLCTGQALHGFAMGASNSHEMAYRQAITPDGLQARTNTTMRSMNRAVVVLIAPLAGLVAEWANLSLVLAAAAVLFAAAALGLWFSPFREARIRIVDDPD
ncbi:MFS transporter [Ruania alba]|uniref:Predicted arabinose efflux permease, MFS family n=1 Tax=Ruania alba TaxID=648782 RepID=A0A1H5N697_9MICO|nr:MFS transporter [Ruania alba]SEE97125.1 Predicted arabinose efflux permease, MFS family [Ruania alba]